MYCNHCGAHNPDDAGFCSRCGNAVSIDATPVAPPAPPPVRHASAAAAPPAAARPAVARPVPVNPKGFVFPKMSASEILDLQNARAHTMAGFVAAIFGVVMSLLSMTVLGSIMFVTAVLYTAIAVGLWKSSRLAAAVGFLVAIANTIALFALTKGNVTPWMLAMTVIFVIAYWNALRGTNAEHRLSGSPPIGAKVKSA